MNDNQQNPPNQGQQQQHHGMFDGLLQQAEQQVNKVIDDFAAKIPGGEQFKDQAKQVADNALENLEQQAEQKGQEQLGKMGGNPGEIGKLFGGN